MERIQALACSDLDSESLRREVAGELRRTVGFDRWVWRLVDPQSVLWTSGVGEHDLWSQVPDLARLEQNDETVNTLWTRVRGRHSTNSLKAATRGDYSLSARWDAVLGPAGVGDELRAASIDQGSCWGDLYLWRGRDDEPFSDDEIELVERASALVAPALRRRAALPSAPAAAPGVLIFDADLRPRSWTDAAGEWLSAATGGSATTAHDAAGALAVVARFAQERALGIESSTARVRMRTTGGWVVIEGANLNGADAGGTAVTIRHAAPVDYLDLLCFAYELTERERELVGLVVDGADTKRIAATLFISPYTVQDHLKSVFAKVGVRSRRELVAALGA